MADKRFLIPLVVIFAGILSTCATGIDKKEVAPVYYNLGNAYTELGEYEKAAEAYLQALSLDEALAQATFNLAKVYIEQGRTGEAVTILQELLEEDPENSILLSTLAYARSIQGRAEEALLLYEEIIDRDPLNKNALYNAGVIEWQLEKREKALAYFDEVMTIDPEDEDAVYNLAMIHREGGDTEKALDYLSIYLEIQPDDIEALKTTASLYFEEEYYARALEIYDRIINLSEEVPAVFFHKAYILLTVIGDMEEGMKTLEKAVLAGYQEEEKYRQLLSHPDLLIQDEIEDYLLEKGLVSPDWAEEDQPLSTDDSVDSTNSSTSSGDPDPSME